jgi:hypothetical protein
MTMGFDRMTHAVPARRLLAATAAALLAALGLITATPARGAAAMLYVAQADPNASDAGSCTQAVPCETIGAAVTKASAGDTVSIASGRYDENVVIHKSLTLLGSGHDTTIHSRQDGGLAVAIGPDDSTQGTIEATLRNLVVDSGDPQYYMTGIWVTAATVHVDGVVSSRNGIGMSVYSGKVDVTDSEFSNNIEGVQVGSNDDVPAGPDVTLTGSTVASNLNTGVEAIGDNATVTVVDSTVRDTGSGVGIRGSHAVEVRGSTVTGNGRGGIGVDGGTGKITDTTIADNHGAGVEAQQSTVTMTRTTVSGTVPFDPIMGVPYKGGMGVLAYPGATVSISESTIYGNTGHGVVDLASSVSVANSTIAATQPSQDDPDSPYLPRPGAVAVASGPGATASATLSATIVTGTADVPACLGTTTDAGYNLDTDGTCKFSSPSVPNADPQLGTLADNSGPTQTVLPAKAKTNAALDAIPLGKAGCTTGATDQRGTARPQGAGCDIGAVELELPAVTISPDALPDGKVGERYSATLTATGGLGAPYVWSLAPGSHLPEGLKLSHGGVISGTPAKAGTFQVTVSVDDPVLRDYTLTIAAASAPSSEPPSSGASTPATRPSTPATRSPTAAGRSSTPVASPPASPVSGAGLADTGSDSASLLRLAGMLLGLGALLLGALGWSRRRGHG